MKHIPMNTGDTSAKIKRGYRRQRIARHDARWDRLFATPESQKWLEEKGAQVLAEWGKRTNDSK